MRGLEQQLLRLWACRRACAAPRLLGPPRPQRAPHPRPPRPAPPQKLTQLEHVLLRPDTYIGSTEKQQEKLWVHDGERMVLKTIDFVPGLYKIFDEILVNAADNKVRDSSMDLIKVEIDQASWGAGGRACGAGAGGAGRVRAGGQAGRGGPAAAEATLLDRARRPGRAAHAIRLALLAIPRAGQGHHHRAEQRRGHPGGGPQGGEGVRAGAHLWQPAHLVQLQRQREEGGPAGPLRCPCSVGLAGRGRAGCVFFGRAHAAGGARNFPNLQVTGGRNGYGAKLANIFSTKFVVETCDGKRKLRYKQVRRRRGAGSVQQRGQAISAARAGGEPGH